MPKRLHSIVVYTVNEGFLKKDYLCFKLYLFIEITDGKIIYYVGIQVTNCDKYLSRKGYVNPNHLRCSFQYYHGQASAKYAKIRCNLKN